VETIELDAPGTRDGIAVDAPTGTHRFMDALERVQPELARLELSQLRAIQLNPVAAGVTLRRALPGILALRPRLLALEHFEIRALDDIDMYFYAWLAANTLFLLSPACAEEFPAVSERVAHCRERLVSEVSTLTKRGRLHKASLTLLKGAVGYKNVATDVLTLTTLLRSNWAQIDGHADIDLRELDAADAAVDEFIAALALRKHSTDERQTAALVRQKTYTLFVNAYDQIRRGVIFIRRQQRDGERIAPSLFAARNRSMRSGGGE
jgi:hypothetical protein